MNSHADYILYPGWPSASLYLNLKYFYNGIAIMMGWCILYTDLHFLVFQYSLPCPGGVPLPGNLRSGWGDFLPENCFNQISWCITKKY